MVTHYFENLLPDNPTILSRMAARFQTPSTDAFSLLEKTALLSYEGQWCLPENATPTTHILKLPLGLVANHRYDLSHSVENEWLCMRLLKELGLPVANVEMTLFEDQKVLVVERFDRRWNDKGWWMRIPHEDLLQAHGLPFHLKYESDGGPGIESIMRLLESSSHSQADQETFFKSLILLLIILRLASY